MGNSVKEKCAKIPVGDSADDIAKRKKLFREFDVNGNQYLSLAEIDKGIRDVLELPELFEAKPVIMRAYQASKNKIKAKGTHGEDYVSRAEYKWTLIYLRFYYELWEDFKAIEIDGDRRISEKEFIDGSPLLINDWKLKIDDPKAKFAEILQKHGAQAHITYT